MFCSVSPVVVSRIASHRCHGSWGALAAYHPSLACCLATYLLPSYHITQEIRLRQPCTLCEIVQYCSIECQEDHMPQHKETCKKRAAEGIAQSVSCRSLSTTMILP
jgi:hypothetical protein